MSASSQWRRALTDLGESFGCALLEASNDHYKLVHPSGWSVFASRSPSDWRALHNVRADLRKKQAGVWR